MTVTFSSPKRTQNRIGPFVMPSGKQIIFNNGRYSTTDKEEIEFLLAHSFYFRGRYIMAEDEDLVSEYLDNDAEPAYITKEYLKDVPNEIIVQLGKMFNAKNQNPSLIRREILNNPITTEVSDLVGYTSVEEAEEPVEETPVVTKVEPTKKTPAKKKSTTK